MKQQNIKVIVRVRPPVEEEKKLCVEVNDDNQISISDFNTTTNFVFDYVAGMKTKQIEMMEIVGKPITDLCLTGYNGTIFAYGQTGSGKTFTMKGQKPQCNMGLMPNIFAYLFSKIKAKSQNEEYSIKCSCLEIYNEHINDLLDTTQANLRIREDSKRRFYVQNLSERPCKSAEDCLRFVQKATNNRKTFGTKMNIRSSRSHLLFTLIIIRRKMINNINPKQSVKSRTCRLNLVDLAGSERQNKTNAKGDRLKEAKHINKSLSTLGRVIHKIIKNEKHIPFRDSQLTKLLKDSIGGNSSTYMIANISPSTIHSNETLSTLRFANSAKQIENKAKINQDQHCSLEALKAENSKFVHILEELSKKYQESQQKNNELNKENTELLSKNNELKLTVDKLTLQKAFELKTKEDKIEELKSLTDKLSTTVNTQKQQIDKLKCEQFCSNNSENEISIHAECECEPWVVVQHDLFSPKSNRKRTHKQSNDCNIPLMCINNNMQKTKKRKINEKFIDSIFTNKCVEKLSCDEIIEIMDTCILKRNQLKELDKERQRRMLAIVDKKTRYRQDIENYGILIRVKSKKENERQKCIQKEIEKQQTNN